MRVAIVAAICADRDAISAAAASQAALAATLPDVESVDLYAEHIGRPLAVPGHVVRDPWTLLRHRAFRAADVAIFHWGIHGPLFDAMTLLPGRDGPSPVLMFHNMTPLDLVEEPSLRDELDASRAQLAHLTSLPVRLWTYSEENRRVLREHVGPDAAISFVPFPIRAPRPLVDRREPSPLRLLSIGRFARAKGTDVLIEAIGRVAADAVPFVVELVGNPAFSSSAFVSRLEGRIQELGIAEHVRISSDLDDDSLWDRLERSHIVISASRHEGLCVPVVEAYLAGCRVVAADGGNLRYIVQPPDPVVPAGDPAALAEALASVMDDVRRGRHVETAGASLVAATYSEATARSALVMALGEISEPAHRSMAWPPILTRQRVDR